MSIEKLLKTLIGVHTDAALALEEHLDNLKGESDEPAKKPKAKPSADEDEQPKKKKKPVIDEVDDEDEDEEPVKGKDKAPLKPSKKAEKEEEDEEEEDQEDEEEEDEEEDQEDEDEEDEPAPKAKAGRPKGKKVTLNDVRDALRTYGALETPKEAMKLLKKVGGADTVPELSEDRYQEVIDACNG